MKRQVSTRWDRRVRWAAVGTLVSTSLAACPAAAASATATPLSDTTATLLFNVTSLAIGLVGGLATGFYFERRAVRQSRRENDEFQRQISILQTTLYSLGAQPKDVAGDQRTLADDLASQVTARARSMQNESGRVRRPDLIGHFVARGADPTDVEAVISSMSAAGAAKEEGEWLQLP
jgi:hypothetical protein